MRRWLLLSAALLCTGCPRTFDRKLVADSAAAFIYHQCQYELSCVSDRAKWKCKVTPPATLPSTEAGGCASLYAKVEELRWQTQTSELARTDSGSLPPAARKNLKAAKKAVEK